jgi:hypothetical protein
MLNYTIFMSKSCMCEVVLLLIYKAEKRHPSVIFIALTDDQDSKI